ncbi:MAG: alpha/beta fold hydrolase, partial [Pseudomonadota bacterium]
VTAGDVPVFMSPDYQAIWDNIQATFPNSRFGISDRSYDESTLIVSIEYPNNPPRYYVTQVGSGEYRELGAEYPDLGPHNLGSMHRTVFEARDGLPIEAFITLPAGMADRPDAPIPFLMMPHGGPAARDYVQYDPLSQLLASRGYGVLQMNFRGSDGYGRQFEAAGEGEWGRAMQDDIADGAFWLIENGYADPDKICIFGWSYGGYAALMGAARPQDPYICAASVAGVTDLQEIVRTNRSDIMARRIGDAWRDRDELRAHSPIYLADQMEIPIFLAHGQADTIVHVQHGIKMLQALSKAGKEVDEVAFALGDHSLSHSAYRQRLFVRLVAFLDEHLSQDE